VPDLDEYVEQLIDSMKKQFPNLKKVKKQIKKSADELYQETLTVKKILAETPAIPDKAGDKYHIVAMDWFKKWQSYTGYEKVKIWDTPGMSSDETDE
jgi:hypothetical protein